MLITARKDRASKRSGTYIFDRLSLHQPVFSVNSRFEVEGLRAETGISPNQPHIPSLSINTCSKGKIPHLRDIPMLEHAISNTNIGTLMTTQSDKLSVSMLKKKRSPKDTIF